MKVINILKIVFLSTMMLQCIFWLVFGIILIATPGNQNTVVTWLMIPNGIAFGLFVLFYRKRNLLYKILATFFLFANLILTVTDQMGFFDYLVLALNIIAIWCCLALFITKDGNDGTC